MSKSDWVPWVCMLAGVNSDEQCEEHKSMTVMTHAERCEAVRHCRWVDEVMPGALWVIDQAFLDKVRFFCSSTLSGTKLTEFGGA